MVDFAAVNPKKQCTKSVTTVQNSVTTVHARICNNSAKSVTTVQNSVTSVQKFVTTVQKSVTDLIGGQWPMGSRLFTIYMEHAPIRFEIVLMHGKQNFG